MAIRTETGLKLTYEDYIKIPEDGRRHEIIDGRHVVSPAPRPRHQGILFRLCGAFQVLEESGRAEVFPSPIDVHLTEIDIVQPDLVALARPSAHLIGELKIEGAPDLVVEILSPSSRRTDRGSKRALYETAGVREYWILDPEEKTLCQLRLAEGRYTEVLHNSGEVASVVFPELTVSLARIFGMLE